MPHTHGAHNANGGITAPQTEEIVSLLRVHVSSGSVSEVARMKLDPSCFLVDDIFPSSVEHHFFLVKTTISIPIHRLQVHVDSIFSAPAGKKYINYGIVKKKHKKKHWNID